MNSEYKHLIEELKNLKRKYPFFFKILLFIIAVLLFLLPLTIWVFYILGRNKVIILTDYTAGELLNYYGTLISSIGTIILGVATIYLSKKANDINDRLIEVEKSRDKPKIDIKSKSISYTEKGQVCSLGSVVIRFVNNGAIAEKFSFSLEGVAFSDSNIIDAYHLGREFICYPVNVLEKKNYFLFEVLVKSDEIKIGIGDLDVLVRNLFLIQGRINYFDIYNEKIEKYLLLFYEKNDSENIYEYCGYRYQNEPIICGLTR